MFNLFKKKKGFKKIVPVQTNFSPPSYVESNDLYNRWDMKQLSNKNNVLICPNCGSTEFHQIDNKYRQSCGTCNNDENPYIIIHHIGSIIQKR